MPTEVNVEGLFNLYFGYTVGILYNDYFDLYAPTLESKFLSDDIALTMNFSYFYVNIFTKIENNS